MNIYLISLLLENTVLGCEQILKRGCFEAIVKVFFFHFPSSISATLTRVAGLHILGLRRGCL